jgi:fluoride exporter
MQKYLLLAIAGMLGVFARYGLSVLVQRLNPGFFPWGTFVINSLGCLAFGMVWSLTEQRFVMSDVTRLIVLTGFMGAFTTFSTYMFETSQLLRDGEWMLATGNILGQNVVGILLMFAGLWIGRFL